MCDCNKVINEKLAEKGLNTVVHEPVRLGSDLTPKSGRVLVVTEKADRNVRKKPAPVFASFCPFCGVKYQ